MWAALLEAGFSLATKLWDTIAAARKASAEQHAAIVAAFKAAEAALDAVQTSALAAVANEEAATEQVIADAEKTKP